MALNSGFYVFPRGQILPQDGTSWSDLGTSPYSSWSNWNTWHPQPQTIELVFTDDLGTKAKRIPECLIFAEGELTVALEISDTGTFTGEQSTVNFVLGTGTNYAEGRYYRWTIQVSTDSDTPLPTLNYVESSYDTEYVVETVEDFDVPSSGTDSSGYTLVPNNLGLVVNVQATALQGPPYVVSDYVADDYIMQQLGGVAVIESKNPLAVQVVDYTGAAWDGTVDLVLRGLPQVVLTNTGVNRT